MLGPELTIDDDGLEDVASEAGLTSESDVGSDAEDVFAVQSRSDTTLSDSYKRFFLLHWQQASIQIVKLLRLDVLLPLHPDKNLPEQVWKNVGSGVALPKWHCCFKGCRIWSDDVRDRRHHEVGLGVIFGTRTLANRHY